MGWRARSRGPSPVGVLNMSECRLSSDGRRVANFESQTQDGDFWFDAEGDPRYLHARLPGGCYIAIRVSETGKPNPNDGRGPVWKWNGNLDRPTLEPSIHTVGHWHGFLQNGRFVSC